jgi:hypothetical protein
VLPDVSPDQDSGTLVPLPDFQVGPYGSAYAILRYDLDYGKKYDCTADGGFGISAGEGYMVQAAARFLVAARGWALPGGEADRAHIAETALAIVDNEIACDSRVLGGGPGWGLDYAWDAFGDDSGNPAYTEYAWQTGMVVRGIVDIATAIAGDAKLSAYAPRVAALTALAKQIIDVWHQKAFSSLSSQWSYYWYSLNPNDAKAVFNTTALLSMAEIELAALLGDPSYAAHASTNFAYFRDAALQASGNGYVWKYGGAGYTGTAAEDVSHATVNEQWMRFEMPLGQFDTAHAARIQSTLLDVVYQGNPAQLASYVDGTHDSNDWAYAGPTALGSSVWGDAIPAASGGRVELWELARNVLLSAQLEANQRSLASPIASALDPLVLAHLFLHRPPELAPDSTWVVHAGDANDITTPTSASGGVRFYGPDWSAPTPISDLPNHPKASYRTATAADANFSVDLPSTQSNDVLVSLTYRAATGGSVQQWDGTKYRTLAPLPATNVDVSQSATPVFFRVTFRLDRTAYFDYGPNVPATNVLLQATQNGIEVIAIEGTPL